MRVFLNICLLLEECNLIFSRCCLECKKISNKILFESIKNKFIGCYDYSYFRFSIVLYSTYLV
ncbi:hypothetical protein NEISUBOT_03040 [Neisseria subflava NJ9703]|uniref:Uncharacterized protein n=1 Tax=Neisseria subflava NJ9703 TaxID=546268 RepID=A0A9W5N085_NEISU|nr:hypothetical protein NEISUBOT_03040 [Neisseria subflava NJ9703]